VALGPSIVEIALTAAENVLIASEGDAEPAMTPSRWNHFSWHKTANFYLAT
jgi:hypothetical protein